MFLGPLTELFILHPLYWHILYAPRNANWAVFCPGQSAVFPVHTAKLASLENEILVFPAPSGLGPHEHTRVSNSYCDC